MHFLFIILGKGTPKSKKAKAPQMRVTSKYVFFYGAQNVFSQFHPAKFVVDGQQYNCMEQYMHHQKAGNSAPDKKG